MDTDADKGRMEIVLRRSIQHYEQILTLLQTIDDSVGAADAAELLEYGETLAELQLQAEKIDLPLRAGMQGKVETGELLQNLLVDRERLLKGILQVNERITAKASGVKSLIAHEMGKLREGLSALNGYKQQQHTQGRIVNSSS